MVQEAIRDDLTDAANHTPTLIEAGQAIAEHTYEALTLTYPGQDFQHWRELRRLLPHHRACVAQSGRHRLQTIAITTIFNQMALFLETSAEYSEATTLLERALNASILLFSSGHPSIATSLNNLASLYESQGRYVEAEPLYKQALTILLTSLGPRHPNTITGLANFMIMLAWKERVEALQLFLAEQPGLIETFSLALAQMQETEDVP